MRIKDRAAEMHKDIDEYTRGFDDVWLQSWWEFGVPVFQ
jgi:hypothetical protein